MSDHLLRTLHADHRRLRVMAEELREQCCRTGVSEGVCFTRFREMKAFFSAQSKAEEYTFYAILEENFAGEDRDVLSLIFQGYEEHDLADMVLKEMGQAEELSIAWCSKLKVFIELVQHHTQKEEAELLTRAWSKFTAEQKAHLASEYERERDELFAKKSGLKKPAFPIFVSSQNLTNHH